MSTKFERRAENISNGEVNKRVEYCGGCGTETKHQVNITLIPHGNKGSQSKHPHRETMCLECGDENQKMLR